MSAYTDIKTKLSDQESLVYGIKAMGYDPIVYDIAQTLSGFSGHKNPKANIVIPRKQLQTTGAAYCDLGFLKIPEGFQCLINDMDERKILAPGGFMDELKLQYNVGLAMKKAKLAGVKKVAQKERVVNGKKQIQLVFG